MGYVRHGQPFRVVCIDYIEEQRPFRTATQGVCRLVGDTELVCRGVKGIGLLVAVALEGVEEPGVRTGASLPLGPRLRAPEPVKPVEKA